MARHVTAVVSCAICLLACAPRQPEPPPGFKSKTNAAEGTAGKAAKSGASKDTQGESGDESQGDGSNDAKSGSGSPGTNTASGAPPTAGSSPWAGGAPSAANGGGPAAAAQAGASAAPVKTTPACIGKSSAYACEGATLYHCTDMGGYDMQRDCTTQGKCSGGLTTGMCGICEPGEGHCTGGAPETCDDTGHWKQGEPCASSALCNDASGQCDPSSCASGEYLCSGDVLEICKTDLTGFMMKDTCEHGLCNQAAQRCNECMPGSKTCGDERTLSTCGDDGLKMPMPCSGETPYCLGDKCVQCQAATDCKAPSDCMDAACDMGTCGTGSPKRLKTQCQRLTGPGVCDLVGNCVGCIDDSDCNNPSLRCNPLNLLAPCESRSPLEATASVLGGYTVTVAPGFDVSVDNPLGAQLLVNLGAIACASGSCTIARSAEARTVTFSGPTCSGPERLPFQTGSSTATLAFSDGTPTDGGLAPCNAIVRLNAKSQ